MGRDRTLLYPKVTIIIPVYNGSNYLSEAIDSALAQTYKNIEVLVVNDGSNDDGATERIALSYGEKIKYISKKNGGVSSALNVGIDNMTGDFFSWLSHDDLYLKNKIQKEVESLTSPKDIVLCDGFLMDFAGNRIKHRIVKKMGAFTGKQLFNNFIHGYNLNGLGFLIPKQAFIECGVFDERMRYLQDLDMWLRLLFKDYNFICLGDELVVTRIHSLQATNTIANVFYEDKELLAKKHYELLNESTVDNTFFVYYYYLFVKGNNKIGKSLFESSLKQKRLMTLGVRMSSLKYLIKGKIIVLGRKVRNLFYKKRKMRN